MKRVRRLRPSQALAGGGGRYRFREVRPGNLPTFVVEQVCGCGFHVCACPTVVAGRRLASAAASEPSLVEFEWHEVETASYDVRLRAWDVVTTDGDCCFVRSSDMARLAVALGHRGPRDALRPGDTVAIRPNDYVATGLNGELFQ